MFFFGGVAMIDGLIIFFLKHEHASGFGRFGEAK